MSNLGLGMQTAVIGSLTGPVRCSKCGAPFDSNCWNELLTNPCRTCGSHLIAAVFPAMVRRQPLVLPERIAVADEASCFYHSENKASIVCERCGRFLCSLCDLEFDRKHLCPGCFATSAEKHELPGLERSRTMFDSLALAMATLPLMLLYTAIVGAPMSLFITARRWNAPSSITPRTKVRFYLAILFSLAEIAGLAAIFYAVVLTLGRRPQ